MRADQDGAAGARRLEDVVPAGGDKAAADERDHAERVALRERPHHVEQDEASISILKIGEEVEKSQVDRLSSLRYRRDSFMVAGSLEALQEAAAGDENLMPYLIAAVKADATLGEITASLKEVFGTYREPVVL